MLSRNSKEKKTYFYFFSYNKLIQKSPFWSLIFWAGVWELVGRMGWMTLLPPLSDIWVAFAELFEQAAFWEAFWDMFEKIRDN